MTTFINDSLNICNSVYNCYKNILDSYVSDFYTENHWNKLSTSWQLFLSNITMEELADILDTHGALNMQQVPLSILCLRQIIRNHSIPRDQIRLAADATSPFGAHNNDNFMKFFWKNVKAKKRHEINIMSHLCYRSAAETNCFCIVDIGSGLGHLSRMLSFGYGFRVVTLEADCNLVHQSCELDRQFEQMLNAKAIAHKSAGPTMHINKRVAFDISSNEFLDVVQTVLNNPDVQFGIVGLHPCGDLGATLLRLYNECSNVLFINMASCCYMKLSLQNGAGFPLSDYGKEQHFKLSYLSCEIACHAIENYVAKLRRQEYVHLKIHAFRAALEHFLTSFNSNLKHMPINSTKYVDGLTFQTYCDKAIKNLPITVQRNRINFYNDLIETTWQKVVIFYSMRLLLAPLVETIVLFDRMMFVEQLDGRSKYCRILPMFDSTISPRNHVITAVKNSLFSNK